MKSLELNKIFRDADGKSEVSIMLKATTPFTTSINGTHVTLAVGETLTVVLEGSSEMIFEDNEGLLR